MRNTTALALLLACGCTPAPQTRGPVSPTNAATPATIPESVAVPPPSSTITDAHCEAGHALALRTFPGDATFVVGIDVAALVHSPLFGPFIGAKAPADLAPMLDAAAACSLGRDTWRSVTFAADFNAGNSIIALRADGAGSPERLACLSDRLTKDGMPPFTVAAPRGALELTFADGSAGWVLDPCTVVIANKGWIAQTTTRMQGAGTPIGQGPLATAISRTDERKHVWFASRTDGPMFGTSALGGATDIAGSIHATSRVDLTASLAFADPTSAAKQAASLKQIVVGMSAMFVQLGLPKTIVDRVAVTAAGAFLMIKADAESHEIAAIAKLFG